MADTKIGNLPTDVVTLADGDKFPIADASSLGIDTFATALELKTYVNTAPVYAAGSASANTWPKFTSGTLLTTAEDGAIEVDADCFYGCTDAGNRGVIPIRHFIRADAARTLANQSTSQIIFNSPTNGTITLETGTYLFEGMLYVTGMSVTSGNFQVNILGAGTATVAAWLWHAFGIDSSTPTSANTQTGTFAITSSSAASVVSATTGTAIGVQIKGTFEVTVAGTLIPSLSLVTAIATASLNIGSYFMLERIGSTTVASVGQWT